MELLGMRRKVKEAMVGEDGGRGGDRKTTSKKRMSLIAVRFSEVVMYSRVAPPKVFNLERRRKSDHPWTVQATRIV